jgi:serine/threonine protein kinase
MPIPKTLIVLSSMTLLNVVLSNWEFQSTHCKPQPTINHKNKRLAKSTDDLPALYHSAGESPIGRGSFGEVRKVTHPALAEPIVVKMIIFSRFDENQKAYLDNELSAIAAMGKYNHSPGFIGCSYVENKGEIEFYVAMELVTGVMLKSPKFLRDHVHSAEQDMPKWLQIFWAIEAMRSEGIVHGDIKLDNVMFDKRTNKMYLIDFGAAEAINMKPVMTIGTPYYMSPAKLNGDATDIMDDVYALVVTMAVAYAAREHFDQEVAFIRLFSNIDRFTGVATPLGISCFAGIRSKKCQKAIVRNIKREFELAKFGTYTESPGKEHYENLTSLFVDIARADSQRPTFETVKRTLDKYARDNNIDRPDINMVSGITEFKFTPFIKQASFKELLIKNKNYASKLMDHTGIRQKGLPDLGSDMNSKTTAFEDPNEKSVEVNVAKSLQFFNKSKISSIKLEDTEDFHFSERSFDLSDDGYFDPERDQSKLSDSKGWLYLANGMRILNNPCGFNNRYVLYLPKFDVGSITENPTPKNSLMGSSYRQNIQSSPMVGGFKKERSSFRISKGSKPMVSDLLPSPYKFQNSPSKLQYGSPKFTPEVDDIRVQGLKELLSPKRNSSKRSLAKHPVSIFAQEPQPLPEYLYNSGKGLRSSNKAAFSATGGNNLTDSLQYTTSSFNSSQLSDLTAFGTRQSNLNGKMTSPRRNLVLLTPIQPKDNVII